MLVLGSKALVISQHPKANTDPGNLPQLRSLLANPHLTLHQDATLHTRPAHYLRPPTRSGNLAVIPDSGLVTVLAAVLLDGTQLSGQQRQHHLLRVAWG